MKELQPTNPVSEQESQTANPVNEQDIEDRINQFLQQNGGNRPIVSRNIFSRSKKTYLDFLNKIESLGDDPHSQRLIMLLEFSLFYETQRVWINGPGPIQPDHDDNIKKMRNQSKKFDEIRAMRKVEKLSENKQDKVINKNPSKEKSEGSFVER